MIRFLFRALATFALAAAVVMAVLDATRSIAADAFVTTPLRESWNGVSAGTFAAAEAALRGLPVPGLWDPLAVSVLSLPGFAVFGGLALIFYLIGHRPARSGRRFAESQ